MTLDDIEWQINKRKGPWAFLKDNREAETIVESLVQIARHSLEYSRYSVYPLGVDRLCIGCWGHIVDDTGHKDGCALASLKLALKRLENI